MRQVLIYFAWSRPAETGAPLLEIEDRFPAIFELRRLYYPKYESLADPAHVDQGITGFLDHVQKPNFAAFAEQAGVETGRPVVTIERINDAGILTPLNERTISDADTIVIISFDSLRTGQEASALEVEALRRFLDSPDHVVFVCPHHDIGADGAIAEEDLAERRVIEHRHHGDAGIPPRQGFGGFARSLLTGLGVPVENRFGLRPAAMPEGEPAPVLVNSARDELKLLRDVKSFNLHPHLPHLQRMGAGLDKMDVLARQKIDPAAPPHPFTCSGRSDFDALLQSRPDTFVGKLLVCDSTMFSSTAGGLENLRQLWSNLFSRPRRSD